MAEGAILAVSCLRIATPDAQDYLSPSNSPHKSMKFHVPALALTLALTILPAASGLTQNAAGGKAPVASSLLDNEQIRVREVRFAPGAKQPAAARPNTFFYALTDGSLVFTPPGRGEPRRDNTHRTGAPRERFAPRGGFFGEIRKPRGGAAVTARRACRRRPHALISHHVALL